MDGIEEDDGYSDDDLDALPVHAFQELQQDAIRSTQQPRAFQQPQLPLAKRSVPAAINANLGGFDRLSLDSYGTQQLPSSDYGDFDDEMLDGEIFDAAAEQPSLLQSHVNAQQSVRESAPTEVPRYQRYANSPPKPLYHQQSQFASQQIATKPNGFGISAQKVVYGRELNPSQEIQVPSQPAVPAVDNPAVLQAKLEELARENERLKRDYDAAKTEAFSKTGEIAIVRANRLKEKQEEEKRLEQERKLRADEQARYNTEMQKYKAELQKISTDKAFIENDLAREAEQRRGLQRNAKTGGKSGVSKATGKENVATTPKKAKTDSFGDGFNNDEIQVQSPSRLALRSKPATPKAGGKRKRKTTDNSPVKPLQLSQTKKDSNDAQSHKVANNQSIEAQTEVPPQEGPKPIVQIIRQEDERFEFTQKVLNHRREPASKRSIEALAEFTLPIKPDQALSTLFYDGLAGLSIKMEVDSFPAALGLVVIDLWFQCLDADMYHPVSLLMDLTFFILSLSPPHTAHHLTDTLTPLVQRTADVNLIPRIRRKPPSPLTACISTKQCLEILHLMAYDLLSHPPDLHRFWRLMRVDFIAMSLKIDQPIPEIHIALDLLRASVLRETFAMIRSPTDGDQESSEQGLIQIISSLFIESPRPLLDAQQPPYHPLEIADLRLSALSLLEKMCSTAHGSTALAKNTHVFVRLIRFMNEELEALYDYGPAHEERIASLNASTRLLYHLTSNFPQFMNIQERLATTPGGAHKYLIVLTRLNFSDGTVFERGIEDDVVEKAQAMLENWVTPEEGEALVDAFGSARR